MQTARIATAGRKKRNFCNPAAWFFVFFPFPKKRTGRRLSFGSFFGRRERRQSSLIRSFTTSPASISPTTGGTKEMLPGGTRPLVGSGAPCGFFGISSE